MASKKTEREETVKDETMTASDSAADLAREFQEEGGKRVNPDILFHKFETKDGKLNPLCGIVLERRQRPRKKSDPLQYYYIIGLTRDTILCDGDGNESVQGKGKFAWVDERWCLSSLISHLPVVREENGLPVVQSVSEIAIIPKGKRELDGGRSLWDAEVYAKPMQPTDDTPLIAPKANRPPPQLDTTDMEDITF
jgi:hypothetical protein